MYEKQIDEKKKEEYISFSFFRMMKVNQVMCLGNKVMMNRVIAPLMLMHPMKNFIKNF
jgi:hypothetical protein